MSEQFRAFRAWLKAQQDRQDAIGDFARDFVRDSCAARVRTLSGIDYHIIHAHNVPRGGMTLWARDHAWREFVRAAPPPSAKDVMEP